MTENILTPEDLSEMEGAWRKFVQDDQSENIQIDEFEPNCPHQIEYYNDEEHSNQCIVGGSGAGKSLITIKKIIKIMLKYPGIEGVVSRTTGPVLKSVTAKQFLSQLPEALIKHRTDYPFIHIELINGSIVNFIAFDREALEKVKSMNLGWFWLEEGSMFKNDAWGWFMRQRRQTTGIAYDTFGRKYVSQIPKRFGFVSTNSAGKDWRWKKFEKGGKNDGVGLLTDPDTKEWICTSYCNKKHLPVDFFREMEKMSKRDRDRFIMGITDQFQGNIFPMMDRDIHVINELGWTPPSHWQVMVGLDWGFQTPTVAIWFTVNPDGYIIAFKEYRESGLTVPQNVHNILTINSQLMHKGMQMPQIGRIDPATRQHKGEHEEGKSVFEQIREEGLRWELETGQKNFMSGLLLGSRDQRGRVTKFGTLLEPHKSRQYHPMDGHARDDGWPRLFFTPECTALVTELEEWKWKDLSGSENDGKEIPEERNDHGIDALGYGIVEYLRTPGLSPEQIRIMEMNPAHIAMKFRQRVFDDLKRSRRPDRQGTF